MAGAVAVAPVGGVGGGGIRRGVRRGRVRGGAEQLTQPELNFQLKRDRGRRRGTGCVCERGTGWATGSGLPRPSARPFSSVRARSAAPLFDCGFSALF